MNDYFLQILMREREREILEEVRGGGLHSRRSRGGSGLSKNIAGRLLSALIRVKAIAGPGQKRQQAADVREKISDPMRARSRMGIDSGMGSSWNWYHEA